MNLGAAAEYPARRDQLKSIRGFVEETCRGYSLTRARMFDLQIAVSEVAVKAIEYSEDGDWLGVRVGQEPGYVIAELTHPRHLRPPRSLPFEYEVGLRLMAVLTDEMAVTQPPHGGTTIRLAVKSQTG